MIHCLQSLETWVWDTNYFSNKRFVQRPSRTTGTRTCCRGVEKLIDPRRTSQVSTSSKGHLFIHDLVLKNIWGICQISRSQYFVENGLWLFARAQRGRWSLWFWPLWFRPALRPQRNRPPVTIRPASFCWDESLRLIQITFNGAARSHGAYWSSPADRLKTHGSIINQTYWKYNRGPLDSLTYTDSSPKLTDMVFVSSAVY